MIEQKVYPEAAFPWQLAGCRIGSSSWNALCSSENPISQCRILNARHGVCSELFELLLDL